MNVYLYRFCRADKYGKILQITMRFAICASTTVI